MAVDQRITVTTLQIARAFLQEAGENPLISEPERELLADAFTPDTPKSFIQAVGMFHLAHEKNIDFFDIEVKG